MFNRTHKNDDIEMQHNVNELADSLEALLKTLGSGAKDETKMARSQAETLLKSTRARLNGNRVTQAARDAGQQVGAYVQEKPWQVVGIGAAVGIVLGALLISRR